MTNLNRLFTGYFIIMAAIVLALVTLLSNLGASLFFRNFIRGKNDNQNVKIVESIREMTADETIPDEAYPMLMAMISRQEQVHLILYSGSNVITSAYSGALDSLVSPMEGDESGEGLQPRLSEQMEYLEYEIGGRRLMIGRAKDLMFDMANADFMKTLNILYAAAFAAAMVVAFFSARILSRRFNKPIMQLQKNLKHISMNRFDKLGECRTKAAELKMLSQDISDLAVQRQKEESMRKRLSNDIVHELKTPISVLSTNIEAIMDGVYEADEKRMSVLLSQTNRLSRLVSRLSELTMIETEYENIHMENTDVSTILENIYTVFLPAASDKGIKMEYKVDDNLYINGNEDKLLQLFVNLLSNSVKYTESGGLITIEGVREDGEIICKISDTGMGIDEKDLPFIFNRFYRGDESRSRKTGGSGIGLAIAKAIVSAHEGEINIESTKGEGTAATVTFKETE